MPFMHPTCSVRAASHPDPTGQETSHFYLILLDLGSQVIRHVNIFVFVVAADIDHEPGDADDALGHSALLDQGAVAVNGDRLKGGPRVW